MKRIPSAMKRLFAAAVVSSIALVFGLTCENVALAPIMYISCESRIRMTIRAMKITAGCGTLFPTRSTPSSMRCMNDLCAPGRGAGAACTALIMIEYSMKYRQPHVHHLAEGEPRSVRCLRVLSLRSHAAYQSAQSERQTAVANGGGLTTAAEGGC